MAEPKTDEAILVRRLDRNTLCGSSDDLLALVMSDKEKTHFLYRVGGTALGVVTGESKFGDWHKLVGQFRAINNKKMVFKSGTAFLPGDIASIIAQKLGGEDAVESVTFLYDVFARYDSSIGPKYGYIIEPVRKPTEGDPLEHLFDEARPLPLLEAPKK